MHTQNDVEERFYLRGQTGLNENMQEVVRRVVGANNPVGALIGYYDENYTISVITEYFLQNLGYTLEHFMEVSKGSLKNIVYGEDVSWLRLERFRVLKGSGEGRMLAGDGAPVAVRLTKEDTVDENGVPIWVISVRMDWAYQNLDLINDAIQSAPWYMECDQESNIANVHWSHKFREMLGYNDILDFPNVPGSAASHIHPEDHDVVMENLHRAIMDKTGQTKHDVEYRMRVADGSYHWFRSIAEVRRRCDGSARDIAGIFINIDNEKNNSLALKKADLAISHLVESMSHLVDHFAICDLQHDSYEYHSTKVNAHVPVRGRYSDIESYIIGHYKTMPPLQSLKECIAPHNIIDCLKSNTDIYKFEYCSMDEDDFRMASFVPLEWEDDVLTKVLFVSMDITSAKENEIASRKLLTDAYNQAENANKAKTEFLSNMSHDLRTPMNAIIGLTAIAGAHVDNPERVESCLHKIAASGKHLLGLINEVLDMARIESGKIMLMESDFDFSELIDNMVAMVKPGLSAHGHHFDVNLHHIEHEKVCGDSLRIQQLFMNFMSNAIKYTPDGGNINFTIEELESRASELGCFRFIIEDNGIGMSKEFQRIMFQPFTRADEHRTSNIQGTGLGMAIARNITEMMNGSIEVTSEPNKGTKVAVTIYLKLQKEKLEKIPELENLPVLVVDDDDISCETTVAALTSIGMAGEWVTSGMEAVEIAAARHRRNNDYFAILVDWQMPGMDGMETAKRLRQRIDPKVAIIVLTAHDYTEIEEEAKAIGVDFFMEKPLFRSKLASMLRNIAEKQPKKTDVNYLKDLQKENYAAKRILLVEDNELNREIAMTILGMSGVQIETAENGKLAVDMIANAPEYWYDLVLMDIQMPVMNGYLATENIRKLEGVRSRVPIVAMTANAFAEDVQLAKNAGMDGHLAKPIELKKLNEVLRKWLG